jgi:SET domain-containing protein
VHRYGHLIALGSDIQDARFSVRASPNRGYGLFASVAFAKGEYLSEYTGLREIVRDQPLDYTWEYKSIPKQKRVAIIIGTNSTDQGNLMRFVNHTNEANLDIFHVLIKRRWHIIYVAKRDIMVGEEFAVDYGGDYWNTRGVENML